MSTDSARSTPQLALVALGVTGLIVADATAPFAPNRDFLLALQAFAGFSDGTVVVVARESSRF